MVTSDMRSRARGCLLGQLIGDALGSQVEFLTSDRIAAIYPDGVRDLEDGVTWGTLAGQPTDDSEMALLLARMLSNNTRYEPSMAAEYYRFWLDSEPFDCGNTIRNALSGLCTVNSQANGALMRVSPLGIFGVHHSPEKLTQWAIEEAEITHPNPVCTQINALFCQAIAEAIRTRCNAESLYQYIIYSAKNMEVAPEILRVIDDAVSQPPQDYITHQGWVLIAFHNALWQMLHAPDFETALVDTVGRGGDTDTNAAICGALLGAIYGLAAIPERWVDTVIECRPEEGKANVRRPRPNCFWPVDALELADKLMGYDKQVCGCISQTGLAME